MKKSVIAVICFALLFAIPFASASFLGWITGKSTAQTTDVNIDVGNTAPTIPYVDSISAQSPVEGTYRDVTFTFEAKDHDDYGDFDNSTALAKFTRLGETARSASCTVVGGQSSGEYRNYTCTVRMWHWDQAGTWDVNVSIADISAARAENSTTTFTYNSLTAFVMSPATLTWPTLTPGQQNVESNNDPSILNNTGNYESAWISVNSTDLNGTGSRKDLFVDANDFASSSTSTDECIGDAFTTSGFIQIHDSVGDNATLLRGNVSAGGTAQANLYYCLTDVDSGLIKQSYTSTANGAWTVKIQ